MTNLEQTKGDQHAILVVDSMALLQDLQMVRRYKKIFSHDQGYIFCMFDPAKGRGGGGENKKICGWGRKCKNKIY